MAELRSEYEQLLYFSVPKLLHLYQNLMVAEPSPESIMHDVGFLFENTPSVQAQLKETVQVCLLCDRVTLSQSVNSIHDNAVFRTCFRAKLTSLKGILVKIHQCMLLELFCLHSMRTLSSQHILSPSRGAGHHRWPLRLFPTSLLTYSTPVKVSLRAS